MSNTCPEIPQTLINVFIQVGVNHFESCSYSVHRLVKRVAVITENKRITKSQQL